MLRRYLVLALLCLHGVRAQQCYGIDGTKTDKSYKPCNPDAKFSPCCASNKNPPDICLSSGLCYAQQGQYKGFIYSNGCTDKTGMASECPHICPDNTNNWDGGEEVATYNVLQCRPGIFCCRSSKDSSNCCDDEDKVISGLNIGELQFVAPASECDDAPETTPSTDSDADTDTDTSQECDANAPQQTGAGDTDQAAECPKDRTAVIGGAVGGVLGAALLASLGGIAFLLTRRPKAEAVQGNEYVAAAPYKYAGPLAQELNATESVYEVEGNGASAPSGGQSVNYGETFRFSSNRN